MNTELYRAQFKQNFQTMSVSWWNKEGHFCQRFFDNCDSEGPWMFKGDFKNSNGEAWNLAIVLRVGEEHYVVSCEEYYKEEDTDDEWVKRHHIGMVKDPEYPIGPEDPLKAQTTMLVITGVFRPRFVVFPTGDKEIPKKPAVRRYSRLQFGRAAPSSRPLVPERAFNLKDSWV